MFVFTKGKEMEELKELFEKGRVKEVVNKWTGIYLRFDDIQNNNLILDNWVIRFNDVDWEETAKLVKEDKMEKVVVKGLNDILEAIKDEKYSGISMGYGILQIADIDKMVKCLNALGGNFEYQEVEVIDSYEKWEEFQCKLAENDIIYDRKEIEFIEFDNNNNIIPRDCGIGVIEKRYNVDLQILKG